MGEGVVFAGILVALAAPFWPGGAAPRGAAIFVPAFPSAPCEPNQGRKVFTVGQRSVPGISASQVLRPWAHWMPQCPPPTRGPAGHTAPLPHTSANCPEDLLLPEEPPAWLWAAFLPRGLLTSADLACWRALTVCVTGVSCFVSRPCRQRLWKLTPGCSKE